MLVGRDVPAYRHRLGRVESEVKLRAMSKPSHMSRMTPLSHDQYLHPTWQAPGEQAKPFAWWKSRSDLPPPNRSMPNLFGRPGQAGAQQFLSSFHGSGASGLSSVMPSSTQEAGSSLLSLYQPRAAKASPRLPPIPAEPADPVSSSLLQSMGSTGDLSYNHLQHASTARPVGEGRTAHPNDFAPPEPVLNPDFAVLTALSVRGW